MRQALRPQLTFKTLLFALIDIVGMFLLASGVMWVARRQSLFFPDFPGNLTEAIMTGIAGLLLMLWAVAQILKELFGRSADNA